MPPPLEYHVSVQYPRPASVLSPVVLFLTLVLAAVYISPAHAQSNSPGFSGHPINHTPSAVTSFGVSHGPSHVGPHAPSNQSPAQHHFQGIYVAPLYYAVPVPYAADDSADDTDTGDNDPDYQGGPTVFDRRGSGAASYIPPVSSSSGYSSALDNDPATADDPPSDDAPQPPTLLVFKDGHKLEVGNYAIVGDTLFDLTPGHPRKIPVANLDLDATRKQNDDHGVIFQLPSSMQAN